MTESYAPNGMGREDEADEDDQDRAERLAVRAEALGLVDATGKLREVK